VAARILPGILVATLLFCSPVQAEEAAGSTAAEPSDRAEETVTDGENEQGKSSSGTGGEPAGEVFIPTEEISEDFAVPFPVDI
jgi:hypothetical protein